jgi:hypothetical protein
MKKVQLLEKLNQMRIEPEGATLTFAARLAAENRWSLAYARRVFSEYRRFLFLAVTAGHPVTPSDEVDQAWHLHLTYTRHYWDILCGQILDRPLHHGPTLGGTQENNRYLEQYEHTVEAYISAFGHVPPGDCWPAAKERFDRRYLRIAADKHWLVPKKAVYAAIPLVTLAACTPVEWAAGGIIAAFVLVVATLGIAAKVGAAPAKKKGNDGSGCGATGCGSDGDCGGGGCGGGCGS